MTNIIIVVWFIRACEDRFIQETVAETSLLGQERRVVEDWTMSIISLAIQVTIENHDEQLLAVLVHSAAESVSEERI